jgi:hypothetical protein
MSADRYATPLRAVPKADESPAAASARLYAEAREAMHQATEHLLRSVSGTELFLADFAALKAAPDGARDLARRMAEQLATDTLTLAELIRRAS